MDFILGLGLALPIAASTGVSVVTGVAEGVSHQQKVNVETSNSNRQLKFHLRVRKVDESGVEASAAASSENYLPAPRSQSKCLNELQNGTVILAHDKLYVIPGPAASRLQKLFQDEAAAGGEFYEPDKSHMRGHHPFTGFFFEYPDDDRPVTRGLVSTICRDPPVLNWVYVDTNTGEVRYSNRTGSRSHVVGSYDWTAETGIQSRVTLQDREGFVAVREDEKDKPPWALYFDLDNDGLRGREAVRGQKVVEVCLFRRLIEDQEVNKWGLGQQGNMGVKKDVQVRPGDS